ncbi:plasmid mobilization relaxosome protein MobC [Candidatus Williamhamiltonella defendens]|uniref:plasmid mobilization relaxosome protein MobC n=1 Tax=Candidatus Williamhamiltonella defendens TaxID=138072 RepID=UPI001F491E22|nr:plasmid mobilization relaxosome protein MobC [Candidatus Hamiltonella defensa]
MTVKRTETVIIRLMPEEKTALLLRKRKPRLAEWLRELALEQSPIHAPKTVDPALLFELNRIGVNLNQIARHCNRTITSIDTVQIALALRRIHSQLSEVINHAH